MLIVDEAQNLSTDSLEQIRLLTNLETPTQKLLQIILLGQPELREKLGDTELRQLAQRITARYHLTPLDRAETEAYVRHRVAVAGAAQLPFSRLGLRALYQRSGGVPRLINIIADRALMAGFAREQDSIGERLVDRAADETLPGHARYWMRHYGRWAAAALLCCSPPACVELVPASRSADAGAGRRAAACAVAPPPPDAETLATIARSTQRCRATANPNWLRGRNCWRAGRSSPDDVSVRDAARCQSAVFAGLNCLRGHATLEQLARFDRPLILSLHAGRRQATRCCRASAGKPRRARISAASA